MLTATEIHTIRTVADAKGDFVTVAICELALEGDVSNVTWEHGLDDDGRDEVADFASDQDLAIEVLINAYPTGLLHRPR